MSAPSQTDRLAQIKNLQKEIKLLGSSGDYDGAGKELVRILTSVCEDVRDAESKHAPNIESIVQNAQQAIDFGVDIACGSHAQLFGFLPSFAHNDEAPLIDDSLATSFGK